MVWYLVILTAVILLLKMVKYALLISGKRASAQRKAKDRIDLERHYGIKNEIKDLGYYLLVYRKKIRNLMRRLKGKPAR